MSARDELRARIARVVRAPGPRAAGLVLVGGCAPALYDASTIAGDRRRPRLPRPGLEQGSQ